MGNIQENRTRSEPVSYHGTPRSLLAHIEQIEEEKEHERKVKVVFKEMGQFEINLKKVALDQPIEMRKKHDGKRKKKSIEALQGVSKNMIFNSIGDFEHVKDKSNAEIQNPYLPNNRPLRKSVSLFFFLTLNVCLDHARPSCT